MPSNFRMSVVSSSSISRIGYDREDKELYIQFHSGRTYKYSDVPRRVVDDLKHAPSIGSFFAKNIRPTYKYI